MFSARAPFSQSGVRSAQARIQFCRTLAYGVDFKPPLIRATCASCFNSQSVRPATLLSAEGAPTEKSITPPVVESERADGVAAATTVGGLAAEALPDAAPTRTSTHF